jgi:hypothetical protein
MVSRNSDETGFSREKGPLEYELRSVRGDLLGHFAQTIIAAEKSHNRLSVGWRPWDASTMGQSNPKASES